MNRIGRERGWPPTSRMQFEAARGPHGSMFVGSPAVAAGKILATHEIFDFDRGRRLACARYRKLAACCAVELEAAHEA